MPPVTYLDHNATTPVLGTVRAAMLDALETGWGNPSSSHPTGRRAREIVEGARARVAALCGASPGEVIFTSGATEAINQAVFSAGEGVVLVSAVEHPAVEAACTTHGRTRVEIPVESRGAVEVERVLRQVDSGPRPALVAVMAANNETGILNPVRQLAAELAERGVPFLVDAVQWAGRLPIDFRPDYLVLTGHKLGGPKGAGALVVSGRSTPRPLIAGGGQERGRRGGTEAVPAIAGFGEAIRRVLDERDVQSQRLASLRQCLERDLLRLLPGAAIVGADVPRLPNTISFTLPANMDRGGIVQRLTQCGIAVSAGSACHAGSTRPSRVLTALGLSDAEAHRTLRFSLGWQTTKTDTERLAHALGAP